MKINTISPDEHNFFQIIETIASKPKTLYFAGKLPTERRPAVAIVGTRKPTPYGKEVTFNLAYRLHLARRKPDGNTNHWFATTRYS